MNAGSGGQNLPTLAPVAQPQQQGGGDADDEADQLEAKFNAGALLRGSMTAQADFFAKALGAGGQQAWMTPNEVREMQDMPPNPDGDTLGNPMLGHNGGPPLDQGAGNG